MKKITLIQGDCLEKMNDIPDASVNMILADLPYGVSACKWDSVIPFEPLWAQYKRIIKQNGAIVLTASQPFTTALIASNLPMFKYCWVWKKTIGSGFINAKNKPIAAHEDICVFSAGTTANKSLRRMPYFPQGLIYAPHHKKRNKTMFAKEGSFIGNRPSHVSEYDVEYTNYPTSVLEISNPNKGLVHPTQKPVALMEYLIKTYTNPGELVLDNCMGSGTTGVACVKTDRNFIGIELDANYFNIAWQRIGEVAGDTPIITRYAMPEAQALEKIGN